MMIGIGLSMDAFAVSIPPRHDHKKHLLLRYAFILAFFFGFFQVFHAFVRMVGRQLFSGVNFCIYYGIAFLLLGFIGVHMLKESLSNKEEEVDDSLSFKTILLLVIATSIDALAVGISFAFLKVDILQAITMI